MNFLQQILAMLFAPLVLFSGMIGLRGGVNEDPNAYRQYKNVILLIGDGMGQNHLDAAKASGVESLVLETLPVKGWSQTNSWPGFMVTESAAGGTALACGISTIVNMVGVFPLDPLMLIATPANLCEVALDSGRLAGVVTTDTTSGATPAAFSAHTVTRLSEAAISRGQMASDLTLLWGGVSASINEAGVKAGGFDALITTRAGMLALQEGTRSFAQFDYDDLSAVANTKDTPTLAEMTRKAIDLLDNKNGFFLMVEGAHIDKHSHDNLMAETLQHVAEFDKAVKVALDYAKKHPSTLVIVTADHETGGMKPQNGVYAFTSGGHTMADVPVFVSVADAGFADGGTWKNRQIGVQLARIMGIGPDVFPTPILPRLGA